LREYAILKLNQSKKETVKKKTWRRRLGRQLAGAYPRRNAAMRGTDVDVKKPYDPVICFLSEGRFQCLIYEARLSVFVEKPLAPLHSMPHATAAAAATPVSDDDDESNDDAAAASADAAGPGVADDVVAADMTMLMRMLCVRTCPPEDPPELDVSPSWFSIAIQFGLLTTASLSDFCALFF
jgi:hypothetical protein